MQSKIKSNAIKNKSNAIKNKIKCNKKSNEMQSRIN